MNNRKIHEIKIEDKKALRKFIIIIIISILFGSIIGTLTFLIDGTAAQWIAGSLTGFLKSFFPVANIILTAAFIFPVIYLYKKCRKRYNAWDGENEEEINRIETGLSYALWFSCILLVLSFFFFAAGSYMNVHTSGFLKRTDMVCWFAGFLAAVVCTIAAQQKIVNFEKEINPEKQGSIFDQKFTKTWENSCDEAERLIIYRAAYKSYRAVTMTCLILWIFCVLAANIWNFGLMPVSIVSVIWLVQVSSYCLEAIRQSKYTSNR